MPAVYDPLYDAALNQIANQTLPPDQGILPNITSPYVEAGQGIMQNQMPSGQTSPYIDAARSLNLFGPSSDAASGGGGGGGPSGPQMANPNDFKILGAAGSRPTGYAEGAAVPRWDYWAPALPTPIASVAEAAQQKLGGLMKDPQLPELPQDPSLDSQFYAEEAMAHQQANQAYQDVLSQYGYDAGGVHIPGAIELAAGRNERDLITGLVRSSEGVVGNAAQQGTVFSGYTGQQLAEKEQPYVTGLGDMAVDVPKALASEVEKAQDVMRSFILQRNLLMSQALNRYAALLAARTAGTGGGTGTAAPAAPQYSSPIDAARAALGIQPPDYLNPPIPAGFGQVY